MSRAIKRNVRMKATLPSVFSQLGRRRMSHASPTSVNPTDAHWVNVSNTGCTKNDARNCSGSRMRIPYRIADYNWGCCNERNSCELREMKGHTEREREREPCIPIAPGRLEVNLRFVAQILVIEAVHAEPNKGLEYFSIVFGEY